MTKLSISIDITSHTKEMKSKNAIEEIEKHDDDPRPFHPPPSLAIKVSSR